jgi:hypothetical protein
MEDIPVAAEVNLADGSTVAVYEDGTACLYLGPDDEEPTLNINLFSVLADKLKENEL